MHTMYFTERPYRYVPNDEVIKNGYFGIENKHFDSQKGAQLFNEYLDEKILAEDLGFDGVMLNEHHDTAFCMGSVMNVEASILARITKKVKIVLLGNPIPIVGNPLRLAEELGIIDMISGGRLVSGWVRGGGSEQYASNANPAFNRELFNEAHEVIVQAWTKPGPFRYEGKHFHYRFIDPWCLPLQKPHPPIWIPGLLSPETVEWCAQKRYPYVALATFLEPTVDLWNFYRDAAAKEGYQVGPENFGYLQKVYVAETDEKAREIAKFDMFGGAGIGYSLFGRPNFMFPPGYNSKAATARIARQFSDPEANKTSPWASLGGGAGSNGGAANGSANGGSAREQVSSAQVDHRSAVWQERPKEIDVAAVRQQVFDAFPSVEHSLQVICGTPETVIKKLRVVLEVLRPGIFAFWQNDGPISKEDRINNIRLIAKEVLPAVRQIGRELNLTSPFEVAPGSRKLPASGKPDSVGSLEPLRRYRETEGATAGAAHA
ncbi:MAG TPA: LLM class flavin-dependent oxidoreductase [Candidatus Binataceae bacterium]|nr:LLM class flavin-dependent oxidoreductase [Candidatus Binataceae bacterium]